MFLFTTGKTDFSWSEIGVAYFFTNTFIAVYVEDWLPYVYVLNLLSLPYPIWSIGYQKFVAKKWCILCVIVQIVILSIFIYNLNECPHVTKIAKFKLPNCPTGMFWNTLCRIKT